MTEENTKVEENDKTKENNDSNNSNWIKKPIFEIKHAIGIIAFCITIIIFSSLVYCGKEPIMKLISRLIEVAILIIYWIKEQITLATFEPKGLLSLQASISFLSITILNIILPNNENRILGLTYQDIFFKWKIFKYFNAADCILYSILMLMCNIIIAVVSTIVDNPNVKNVCNFSFIIILFTSVILALYMLHMSLIAKFKKSRIYYLIYKQIEKDNRELYNSILKALVWNVTETSEEKFNYDYYVDEIKILKKMNKKIIAEDCLEVGSIRLSKEAIIEILQIEIAKRQEKRQKRADCVRENLEKKYKLKKENGTFTKDD